MKRLHTASTRWLVPTFLLLFSVLYLQLGCAAHAIDSSGGGWSVTLVDAWGRELPTYRHRGQTFILGNHGDRYGVRVRNQTAERVEVVVTVDGRDVLTGDVGDYRAQRGYLVNPWQTVTIEGFRKSMSEVAAFRFTSPGNSYTARRGTPQHVGVVGVAVFREKDRPRPQPVAPVPYEGRWRGDGGGGAKPDLGDEDYAEHSPSHDKRAPQAASEAEAPSGGLGRGGYAPRRETRNNIGTQYGETRNSSVVEVPFTRARPENPDRLLAVYYDDRSGLEARGIRVAPVVSGEPDPFPSVRRFAPPPP
jgi:hypothetical protein